LCLGYVKIFAISVGTGVTTLIAVVAVSINHNLFFNSIKNGDNGIGTFQNCFVVASFAVADLYLNAAAIAITVLLLPSYQKPRCYSRNTLLF
jgi:hypothetical protein